MKTQRLALLLTFVNLVLLVVLLTESTRISAQATPDVVRARMWQLVDQTGQVRASLEADAKGDAVFRLRDASGTIRVKLAAGRDGSGLLLLDQATEPGVQLDANAAGARLQLKNRDGRERVIAP